MLKPKDTIKNIIPYETDNYRLSWDFKLDSNENVFGCCDFIFDVLKDIKKEDISFYPCYGKLLDKLKERYNIENVLLTNGCDEALSLIVNTYMQKNDEILSFSPTFSMPELYANAIGAKSKKVEYDKKYVFDKEKLERNIKRKTKIVYIATPNNPTGEIAKVSDIDYLLKKFKNTLFIVDCTYINFSTETCFEDYIKLVETNNNIAVLKSFSKDYALAGLRLGFICANSEIINNLKKVASPYNVNMIAAICTLKALENENYFIQIKEKIIEAKKILFEGLKNLGFTPYESQANFILCDFKNKTEFVYNKLKKEGIITRRYNSGNLKTFLRITIPTVDGVKKILEIIKPKPIYVFDMDGVIFDVSDSYRQAIIRTFEYFVGNRCTNDDIQEAKNLGGMSNDWKLTHYLIKKAGKNPNYNQVVDVFQRFFYNPESIEKGLIDKERIVFGKDFFEKLSKKVNLAIFTSRNRQEAFYSLEKFDVKKYFDWFICAEDVGKNCKPSGFGLNIIKEKCVVKEVYYFGDTIDDINAGLEANVEVYGVIPPNAIKVDETIQSLTKSGAYGIIEKQDDILNLKKENICL